MKNLIYSYIIAFSSFIMHSQTYKQETTLAESLNATQVSKDIALIANKKLIWHNFPEYKKDNHLHQYYILQENKKDDFIFFTPHYDCSECLHIEFKPLNHELILYRIAGSYKYLSNIWSTYFKAQKKSNVVMNDTFSSKYKFFKDKYVWVIEKI